MQRTWHARSPERMPDDVWRSTVRRVRDEFAEMPSLRVTMNQARMLFGLSPTVSRWVLDRLTIDGFLDEQDGEFLRRADSR